MRSGIYVCAVWLFYGKLADPALSLIEKLGDVASSLTSLTQKPGKEGEKKRGENTLKTE